jgi:hypothetical protein
MGGWGESGFVASSFATPTMSRAAFVTGKLQPFEMDQNEMEPLEGLLLDVSGAGLL